MKGRLVCTKKCKLNQESVRNRVRNKYTIQDETVVQIVLDRKYNNENLYENIHENVYEIQRSILRIPVKYLMDDYEKTYQPYQKIGRR